MEEQVSNDKQQPRQVVVDERRCASCREWKPLGAFHRRSGGSGYRSKCKSCRSAARRARPVTPEGTKRCPSCSRVLEHARFYQRPDGSLHSWCADCEGEKKREQRAEGAGERARVAQELAQAVLVAGEKTCPRCDTLLPLDAFAPAAGRLDGRERRCRVCARLRSAELDPEDRGRAQEWEMRSRARKERFKELAARGRPGAPGVSEHEAWDKSGQASEGHAPPEIPE
jgi:hypothetical protein